MKHYTTYECEVCGRHSKDREAILQCEASHYGLSIDEKFMWDVLKNKVDSRVGSNSAEELERFEAEHNLNKSNVQA